MTGLTERLAAQARRFAESGAAPAQPRLSATVLLLRPAAAGRQGRRLRSRPAARRWSRPEPGRSGPGQGGVEIYLQRRASGMAFASGMYAFPGGAVDGADFDGPPLPGDWPVRLGRPAGEAWAVVRAAVREVAEETGVRVTAGDLVPWSRWITPVFEPRRYDTYFFLAGLPDGQQPANVSGEADQTQWLPPAEAVARAESGEIVMLPPTAVTLGELTGFRSVDAALAAAADRDAATPILPRIEWGADGTARLVQ